MDQALNSQKTPHTSPLRASYGMSFVSILMKNDRVIKGFYCICWFWSNAYQVLIHYGTIICHNVPKLCLYWTKIGNIDWLVHERCNSSALGMELCLSCTNSSILLPLCLLWYCMSSKSLMNRAFWAELDKIDLKCSPNFFRYWTMTTMLMHVKFHAFKHTYTGLFIIQ